MEEHKVPYHLRKLWQAASEEPYWLHGKCVCPCGCDRFRITAFADKRENGYPCTAQTENGFALCIHGICESCGERYVLFDASRHGYDCSLYTAVPEDTLSPWVCPDCQADTFGIELFIQPEEDTLYDAEEEQSEAFGWIRMDLSCPGHTHTEWISLETM